MANIRAILKEWDPRPGTATSYNWYTRWKCWPSDLTGQWFELVVTVPALDGDTATQIKTKIINALTAAISARQPGDTLQVMQSIDFARWV
jgi:hypothetical protein